MCECHRAQAQSRKADSSKIAHVAVLTFIGPLTDIIVCRCCLLKLLTLLLYCVLSNMQVLCHLFESILVGFEQGSHLVSLLLDRILLLRHNLHHIVKLFYLGLGPFDTLILLSLLLKTLLQLLDP